MLKDQEHVVLLDFSDKRSLLLHACFDEDGDVCELTHESLPSKGIKNNKIQDSAACLEVVRELIVNLEQSAQIKIQTLFIVLRWPLLSAYKIESAEPYTRILDEDRISTPMVSLPVGEVPAHMEVVKVLDDESPSCRWAFAADAQSLENTQQLCAEAGVFIESWLTPTEAFIPPRKEEAWAPILELQSEGATCRVFSEESLMFSYDHSFSTSAIQTEIIRRFSLNRESSLEVLEYAVGKRTFDTLHWDIKEIDMILKEKIHEVREIIEEELERMAGVLESQLKFNDLYDRLSKKMYVYGETSHLYFYFTFLRDILPCSPEKIYAPFHEWFKSHPPDDLAGLLRLLPCCLSHRGLLRDEMSRNKSRQVWRDRWFRLLGR